MVLIAAMKQQKAQKLKEEFPSPCGDYGSYRLKKDDTYIIPQSFRPLAEIMVLITTFRIG